MSNNNNNNNEEESVFDCFGCGRGNLPTSACGACKVAFYCSRACQKQHWKEHKPVCKRLSSWCQSCGTAGKHIGNCCYSCGYLLCDDCNDATTQCPSCAAPTTGLDWGKAHRSLMNLCVVSETTKNEPRRAKWLLIVGDLFEKLFPADPNPGAIECFNLMGRLGVGEGYSRIAEHFAKKGDWDKVLHYTQLAASLNGDVAICWLGVRALRGRIILANGIEEPEERAQEVNPNLGFRYFMKLARLGHALGCAQVSEMYETGDGVQQDKVKAFEWYQKGAKLGDPGCMYNLSLCYSDDEFYQEIPEDRDQMMFWLEASAKKQHPAALRALRRMGLICHDCACCDDCSSGTGHH